MATPPFAADAAYVIKRPFFSFFDRTFRVYDAGGAMVLFVRHPLLRLRTEFRLFADEAMLHAVAAIQARQALAINFAYDVTDPNDGRRLGTLRSRGFRSIVRDTWDLLGESEQEIGIMTEDGWSMLRHLVPILVGHWHVEVGGETVATIDQRFRLFTKEYRLTIHASRSGVDPRFLMACALLALMREDRREERSR
ncbi:MAG: hypothetical protein HYR75_02225 [Gemmatimonadetes bacterium]|nr:hypothetical protein [Gemmatimonadota bacterium]MBI3566714.1 hypothetical protein [Gemmatimonadota bacterium]